LPAVVLHWETWRRETLDRVMREFDDLERRARPTMAHRCDRIEVLPMSGSWGAVVEAPEVA